MLEPVKKVSVVETIIERVLTYIKSEELSPGDKLPTERELGRMLQVSRTSLREALSQIQAMNIIEIRQGSGIFFKDFNIGSFIQRRMDILSALKKPSILELLYVRRIVERETVRLAARNIKSREVVELEAILRRMDLEMDDRDKFFFDDLEYHLKIAEFSGNSILPRILDTIRFLHMKELRATTELPGAPERAQVFHWEILQTLKSRDAERAEEKMMAHLGDVEEQIMSYLAEEREEIKELKGDGA
jgi:GntR family transcriptional repressor for pyruvate dehydrogenase complex